MSVAMTTCGGGEISSWLKRTISKGGPEFPGGPIAAAVRIIPPISYTKRANTITPEPASQAALNGRGSLKFLTTKTTNEAQMGREATLNMKYGCDTEKFPLPQEASVSLHVKSAKPAIV